MESDKHKELIQLIRLWIGWNYPNLVPYLDDDLDSNIGRARPPSIAGYRPDAFVAGAVNRTAIIGEAKTELDLDSSHTALQLEAYVDYLANQPSGVLVVSTEWRARRTAKSLVKRLVRKVQPCQIETYTITDIDQFEDASSSARTGDAK